MPISIPFFQNLTKNTPIFEKNGPVWSSCLWIDKCGAKKTANSSPKERPH
jgi:hypothetical protein